MVEINNQRKAFLDMLAWSEGTDNGRQKTRNHGYDVIVGGELFTDYSDHPRKLVTLNPKLKSTAAPYRAQDAQYQASAMRCLIWIHSRSDHHPVYRARCEG
jgi:muramidase (phage lysozyme)